MALTERLGAYNLNWAATSPEDVARGELRRSMEEENADLLCRYLNLYGYGEALIQQYGGELTDYGLLTRADGQPVQKPLPPQPTAATRIWGCTIWRNMPPVIWSCGTTSTWTSWAGSMRHSTPAGSQGAAMWYIRERG